MVALWVSLMSSPTMAQQLSQSTASKVQRAHQFQQDDKLDQAIALLASISTSKAYDQAFIARMLGVFYWQQGDLTQSVKQLSGAVESGLLQDEQAWATQKMLADVLLSDEQFERALPHYYALTKTAADNKQRQELWLRIVQVNYQLADWQKVLTAAVQYEKHQSQEQVTVLTMKLGAQLQLKQWQASQRTLQRLLLLEPNKLTWWQQSAGIALRLKQYDQALATLALAKRQQVLLSPQDLTTLAQLYAKQGIPERAAQTLAQVKGADQDPALLAEQASYWQMAKEWQQATHFWALAAKKDNKHRWALVQLLLQEGHHRQALKELEGVSGRKELVELARVRAYYKLEQIEQALIHAKRAYHLKASNESRSWIEYLTQLRAMEPSQDKSQRLTAR